MKRLTWMFFVMLACMLSSILGYGAESLTGAGATFPYPLYDKWFNIYHHVTGVKINYQYPYMPGCSYGYLQYTRQSGVEADRKADSGHFYGEDHKVERSKNCRAQQRGQATGYEYCCGAQI